MMIGAWLRFFRVVNLPTVPGDVWVGAVAFWYGAETIVDYGAALFNATVASVFVYLFGLADNDIVGAKTDVGRPIPNGQISLRAARIARALCLAAVVAVGFAPDPVALRPLPPLWWFAVTSLALAVLVYNRTKSWALMGLCRGLNVVCGGAVAWGSLATYSEVGDMSASIGLLAAVATVWTVYVAVVTKYSEGEELDPERKRRVGFLVGAIVYLQIIALLAFQSGIVVLVGVLLVVLRLLKRHLPGVSAS